MKFECPDCSQLMEVETIYAGRKVECPSCGKTVEIPAAADDVEVVPPVSEDPGMSVNQPSPGDENLRTIVETLWGKTIRAGDKPEMTLKPGTRDDITIPGKGETMRGPRSDGGKMPDAVKVRPKDISQKGSSATVPEYEILRMLGEGGMGMVYEARQTAIDRSIAIKMIKPEAAKDEEECRLFLAEAVATADLDHPNIVPIHDLGMNSEGALFYAMKQVKGTSWKDILPEKSLDENLDILMRVADAVAFAHNRGVIHRDLKPENVMLGDFGEVLLMDWGLAAAVTDEAKADKLDPDHAIGGTPSYMAPEMAVGDASKIGYASDVYLLGAILFEIVTGQRPHSGTDVMECLANAAENKIEEVEESNELIDIALKAMATEPTDRYESVKAFQSAVREYQQHEESIVLVSKAHRALEEARKTKDYERFVDAVSGCKQALELWSGNERANVCLTAARLAYAECAFEKRDLDLAVSLLNAKEPSHSTLLGRVEKARNERDSRRNRLRVLKITSAISIAAAVLILSVASIWINKARKQAEAALNSLRDTAPTFYQLAQKMMADQDFAGALTNINYVVSLIPEEARYHHQRGNILQTLLHMEEAASAYETAVRCDPDSPHSKENMILCRKIIKENTGRQDLIPASIGELLNAMQAQNRYPEFIAVSAKMKDRAKTLGPMLKQLLESAGLTESWQQYLKVLPDGTVDGTLRGGKNGEKITDISILKGIPVSSLNIAGSQVSDLSPLRGAPLTNLVAYACPNLKDLSCLRDTPLKHLYIASTGFEDLSSLKGMKLTHLLLGQTWNAGPPQIPVKDFSPLTGMPLRLLDLSGLQISDLSPLQGMPLNKLLLTNVRVGDLTPLRDLPLEELDFMPDYVEKGIEELRSIKTLKKINGGSAEAFWSRYDAGDFFTGAEFKEKLEKAWPGSTKSLLKNGAHTLSLGLRGRKDVLNLKPLEGIPVSNLNIADTQVIELSPLSNAPLTNLVAFGCTRLKNLEGLRGTPLQSLSIAGTAVEDLSSLKGIKLSSLDLGSPTYGPIMKIEDLSPLAEMPLKRLLLRGVKVRDLSPLRGMPLEELDFMPEYVKKGIEELRSIKTLKKINGGSAEAFWSRYDAGAFFTGIEFKEQLEKAWPGSTKNLQKAEGCTISLSLGNRPDVLNLTPLEGIPVSSLTIAGLEVSDLSPLSNAPLTKLVAYGCTKLKDLSCLSGTPLRHLDISGTAVEDLSPLKGMKLTKLVLGADYYSGPRRGPVKDISPLAGMPLTDLNLTDLKVDDLSPLAEMPLERLNLKSVQVVDLTPLQGMPLEELVFEPGFVEKGLDGLRSIKTLRTINKMPAGKFWQKYDAGEFKGK